MKGNSYSNSLVVSLLLSVFAGCSSEDPVAQQYKTGMEWIGRNEPDEALASFNAVLAIDSDNVKALHMRGVSQQRLEKNAEARRDYDAALKLDPKFAEALASRASLNFKEDLLEETIRDATAAIELDPKLGVAYLQRSKANLRMGKYDEAIADIRTSIKLVQGNPENVAESYAMLGHLYLLQQDYTEASYNFSLALDYYNEQIRRFPKHQIVDVSKEGEVWAGKAAYEAAAESLAARAQAYLAVNKNMDALEDAKKATRLDETSTEALYQKAVALCRHQRFFEAKQDLKKAILLDPERADLYNLRAWISATCDQPMDRDGLSAVQDALRACELTNHENPDYLETLAAAYAESDNYMKAIQWQHEAIRLAGDTKATERRARLQLYEQKQPFRDIN